MGLTLSDFLDFHNQHALPFAYCQCFLSWDVGDKGKKAFAHVKSRQHRARRLRTLQEVVSGELGAEYLVRHLPDTGQIVLTPVDGGGGSGALPTAPSMWEKTVAAVWRIRSLHLSRTVARYLTPHLVEGVPWEDVWVTMQQLAQPASEGFVAKTGDETELYGAFCPLPARLQHLYRCRPVEPAHVQQPGNPRLHWMPLAVDSGRGTRHPSCIAPSGVPVSPIN